MYKRCESQAVWVRKPTDGTPTIRQSTRIFDGSRTPLGSTQIVH